MIEQQYGAGEVSLIVALSGAEPEIFEKQAASGAIALALGTKAIALMA